MTLGIPYRVVGGLRFYERMEIRDAIAYLRVTNQPKDDLAFERIINTPKRGVGKSTLEKLHAYAREHNCSLFEATCAGTQGSSLTSPFIKGKAAAALAKLTADFIRWQSLQDTMSLPELADLMLDESGYRAMWEADKSPEAAGRLDNLKELIRALGEFDDITAFLEHVGLVSAADESENGQMLSIMTLHAAKGLEFDIVFLPGWEEGLFPSQRSMDEKGTKGLEEERRLAYVGITRARQCCTISFAANRRIYNQWQNALPSRFVDELPEEHIDVLDTPLHARRSTGPSLFQKEMEDIFSATHAYEPPHNSFEDFPQDEHHLPQKGARVFHQKFGHGVVLATEGENLTIAFKHAGKKKVMMDYIQMA